MASTSMKIIDRINERTKENKAFWSFEYFPPKTSEGLYNLWDRLDRMCEMNPVFIDVTWGAGGSTSELTTEICSVAQSRYRDVAVSMHLTCTNMHVHMIDKALKDAKEAGIRNILALRGDPPVGQERWESVDGGFRNAVDLLRYIRKMHGDYFCIAVAGYPEGHLENEDKEADLRYLKEKVDAGGDYIVTQLFYDTDMFLAWVQRCRAIGITCPIVPGMMPIQTYAGWKRMTSLCKTLVPDHVREALEKIKDDEVRVKDYGVQLCAEMCQQIFDAGIMGFHFYTLNLEVSTARVLASLPFVTLAAPRPGPAGNLRKNEDKRPIFWSNREASYLARTASWTSDADDFPNGRWGDWRSPAYGELDGYGTALHIESEAALAMWGQPQTKEEIYQVFVDYCQGQIKQLPWCVEPLSAETSAIRDATVLMNRLGYLTINSQPAVNGVPASDPVFGWGSQDGFVYQKAYLEFFCSATKLKALEVEIQKKKELTYYSVDRKASNFRTNCREKGKPLAVTWGVFYSGQILQPTVIDATSFLAWKDEAFQLWNEWAKLYAEGSKSRQVMDDIMDNWLLVTVVDNNYVSGDIFSIFGKGAVQSL